MESKLASLFEEHLISIADRKLLPIQGDMTLDVWLVHPHVLVVVRPETDNKIDAALTVQGLQRNSTLILPHWDMAYTS